MPRRQFSIHWLFDHLGHVHTAFWIAGGAGGVMAGIVKIIGSLLPHFGWVPQALLFVISVAMVYVGLRLQERRIRNAVANASAAPMSIPLNGELVQTALPIPAIPVTMPLEPARPMGEPQSQARSTPKPEERIIVDIPPADLTKLYHLYTGVQAEKLIAIYIGKWMRVAGPFGEADSFGSFIQVMFKPPQYGIQYFYMYFGMEWAERLSVLQRGTIINVLGRIRAVEGSGFHLEACELVDASSSVTSQT